MSCNCSITHGVDLSCPVHRPTRHSKEAVKVTLDREAFTITDLEDLQIIAIENLESKPPSYTIKARCGLNMPLGRILELMADGMNFTVALGGGKKYRLTLEEI